MEHVKLCPFIFGGEKKAVLIDTGLGIAWI
jgi:hypothetical protein